MFASHFIFTAFAADNPVSHRETEKGKRVVKFLRFSLYQYISEFNILCKYPATHQVQVILSQFHRYLLFFINIITLSKICCGEFANRPLIIIGT